MIALRLKFSHLLVLAIFFLITLNFQSLAFGASGLPDSDIKILAGKITRDAYPPDAYEPDDTYSTANPIIVNYPTPQRHNFSHQGDQDWVKFYGLKGVSYRIQVSNAGQSCDAVIDFYASDGVTLIQHIDQYKNGHDENYYITITNDGVYYVRITNYDPNVYGAGTDYDLSVNWPTAPSGFALIDGFITDSVTGAAISGASIKDVNNTTSVPSATAISGKCGSYIMEEQPQGTYTLTVIADGYQPYTQSVTVPLSGEVILNIKLTPSATSTIRHPVRDFNCDGKSDILMQNTSGAIAQWQMNGSSVIGGGYVTSALTGWNIVGVGDFDGTGKSDILLQNSTSGAVAVWLMNGTTNISGGYVTSSLDPTWQIKGIGDFDGDGKSDILLQNSTTGALTVWLMNGTAIIGGGYVTSALTGWQIKGVGDFNGDGKSDILLQNSASGAVAVWMMSGYTVTGGGYVTTSLDPTWQIKGVGDFDGDGKSDIILQNSTTGLIAAWLMNGAAIKSGGYVTPTADTSWVIKGVGDFDGNGKSDILLQNSASGAVVVWLMNGTTINGGGYVSTSLDPSWLIK